MRTQLSGQIHQQAPRSKIKWDTCHEAWESSCLHFLYWLLSADSLDKFTVTFLVFRISRFFSPPDLLKTLLQHCKEELGQGGLDAFIMWIQKLWVTGGWWQCRGTTVSWEEALWGECEGRRFQSLFYVWKPPRNFYFLPYSSADTKDEFGGRLGLPRAKWQK